MFPRTDFIGFGYRCGLLNYENEPMFNVSSVFKLNLREAIPNPSSPNSLNGARMGAVVKSEDCSVNVPLIEAKGKFEFYIVNAQNFTQFVEIVPPTVASVEFKRKRSPMTVDLRQVKNDWFHALFLTPTTRPSP
jgi:hypothetical protein